MGGLVRASGLQGKGQNVGEYRIFGVFIHFCLNIPEILVEGKLIGDCKNGT